MLTLYSNINKTKTKQNVKTFLTEYHAWHLEQARFSLWFNTVSEDNHNGLNISSFSITSKARASFECQLRLKTLAQLTQISEHSAFLSQLLTYRYIQEFSVKKTCEKLAEGDDNQSIFITERSFSNYLNEALWEFAIVCPRNLMVKK